MEKRGERALLAEGKKEVLPQGKDTRKKRRKSFSITVGTGEGREKKKRKRSSPFH